MISPMFGSLMLKYLAWNWIFAAQALLGLIALVGVFKTLETHSGGTGNSLSALRQSYQRVLSNRKLTGLVLCNAIVGLPLLPLLPARPVSISLDFNFPKSGFLSCSASTPCALWPGQ